MLQFILEPFSIFWFLSGLIACGIGLIYLLFLEKEDTPLFVVIVFGPFLLFAGHVSLICALAFCAARMIPWQMTVIKGKRSRSGYKY